MSTYIHFYRGYSDSKLTPHAVYETLQQATDAIKNEGGYIVKALEIELKDED